MFQNFKRFPIHGELKYLFLGEFDILMTAHCVTLNSISQELLHSMRLSRSSVVTFIHLSSEFWSRSRHFFAIIFKLNKDIYTAASLSSLEVYLWSFIKTLYTCRCDHFEYHVEKYLRGIQWHSEPVIISGSTPEITWCCSTF